MLVDRQDNLVDMIRLCTSLKCKLVASHLISKFDSLLNECIDFSDQVFLGLLFRHVILYTTNTYVCQSVKLE